MRMSSSCGSAGGASSISSFSRRSEVQIVSSELESGVRVQVPAGFWNSELLEVGDLSCGKTKPDRAVVGLFSDHDDGQGRKRSPQATVGQAPISTPAMAGGVTDLAPCCG
jgi:hypothetical protein